MTLTDISIKDYFERLLNEHGQAHREHQAAHDREHQASQKAIDTASELARANKADANEWRDAMTDRERDFARNEAVNRLQEDINRRLVVLEKHAAEVNGALGVARFIGFGGFITGLGALTWIALQSIT